MGALAARYGLSRSALLYYDRIGVLSPSGRSAAGYRRYSPTDAARLARICRYRQAGLSLDVIRDLLDRPAADLTEALATRLEALNEQVRLLRRQKRHILSYLRAGRTPETSPFLTAERFVELLELAGVSAAQRTEWHAAFERSASAEHQAFLEFLCLPDSTIERIRQWAGGRAATPEEAPPAPPPAPPAAPGPAAPRTPPRPAPEP